MQFYLEINAFMKMKTSIEEKKEQEMLKKKKDSKFLHTSALIALTLP